MLGGRGSLVPLGDARKDSVGSEGRTGEGSARKLGEHWAPEQGVVVEISEHFRDQETGAMQPCVSVRLAGYVAHHLSHVLADWSTIGELMESGRGADETPLAAVLHDAAHRAGDPGARRCQAPVKPARGDFGDEREGSP
jgi:hypothetical protein